MLCRGVVLFLLLSCSALHEYLNVESFAVLASALWAVAPPASPSGDPWALGQYERTVAKQRTQLCGMWPPVH